MAAIFLEILYYINNHPRGSLSYIRNVLVQAIIATISLPISMILAILYLLKKFKKSKPAEIKAEGFYSKKAVILIHGTFEPRAAWVFGNSELKREIEMQLGAVQFYCLSWDGKNSQSSRHSAALTLAEFIRKNIGREFYIVAHSHGGNIAIDALSMLNKNQTSSIKKVALLSVPVLNIIKRETTKLAEESHATAMLLLYSLGILPILNIFHSSNEIALAIGLSIVIAFIVAFITKSFALQADKLYENHTERRHRFKTYTKFYGCIGDEANAVLDFSSLLAEFSFRPYVRMSEALDARNKKITMYPKFISLAMFAFFIILALLAWVSKKNNTDMLAAVTAMQIIACTYLIKYFETSERKKAVISEMTALYINAPASIFFFLSNAMMALAFGMPKMIFSQKYGIYPSKTPIGEWHGVAEGPDGFNMAHSTHSHKKVISHIAKWFSK